jgi:hypothetical protein
MVAADAGGVGRILKNVAFQKVKDIDCHGLRFIHKIAPINKKSLASQVDIL